MKRKKVIDRRETMDPPQEQQFQLPTFHKTSKPVKAPAKLPPQPYFDGVLKAPLKPGLGRGLKPVGTMQDDSLVNSSLDMNQYYRNRSKGRQRIVEKSFDQRKAGML